MARPRHGRSGGGSTPDSGLPSWAQRHLDEAGELDAAAPAVVPPTRHRRSAAPEPSRLRGWGVAIVSVAAAVTAVPLAITSLANDHSGEPLPKVDTYTAGSPGPLQAEGGAAAGAPGRPAVPAPQRSDPASSDVLGSQSGPAVAPAAPVPAALVRPTPAVVAPRTTVPPKPVTPAVTPAPKPVTSTTTADQGRSATKPPPSSSGSKPSGGGSSGGGSSGGSSGGGHQSGGGGQPGLVGQLGNTVGNTVNTVGNVANGLLGGG
jgi:uncharacterized membrane protein YgcG